MEHLYKSDQRIRSTTILAVRHNGRVAIAGDGQVTVGATIMKQATRKVRRLYHDQVVCGFAGASADAFTLFERFEAKLEQFGGNPGPIGRGTGQGLEAG